MRLAAIAALAVVLATGVPAGAQTADPPAEPLPISLERIREGLERQSTLRIPDVTGMAYFRATIEEPMVFDTVLEAMRRDLARWPGTASNWLDRSPGRWNVSGSGVSRLGEDRDFNGAACELS